MVQGVIELDQNESHNLIWFLGVNHTCKTVVVAHYHPLFTTPYYVLNSSFHKKRFESIAQKQSIKKFFNAAFQSGEEIYLQIFEGGEISCLLLASKSLQIIHIVCNQLPGWQLLTWENFSTCGPLEWLASNFSLLYHPWIKNESHESRGDDH